MSLRLQQLFEFLKESPNDPFLLYAIASEYAKTGNPQEALARYTELTTTHPDYVGTYYHLGKLHEAMGQAQQAIDVYERGMEIAKSKRDRHALSELQGAWRLASGLDEDDDE